MPAPREVTPGPQGRTGADRTAARREFDVFISGLVKEAADAIEAGAAQKNRLIAGGDAATARASGHRGGHQPAAAAPPPEILHIQSDPSRGPAERAWPHQGDARPIGQAGCTSVWRKSSKRAAAVGRTGIHWRGAAPLCRAPARSLLADSAGRCPSLLRRRPRSTSAPPRSRACCQWGQGRFQQAGFIQPPGMTTLIVASLQPLVGRGATGSDPAAAPRDGLLIWFVGLRRHDPTDADRCD